VYTVQFYAASSLGDKTCQVARLTLFLLDKVGEIAFTAAYAESP